MNIPELKRCAKLFIRHLQRQHENLPRYHLVYWRGQNDYGLYYDSKAFINLYAIKTKNELIDTLLHETIHHWTKREKAQHGPRWKKLARRYGVMTHWD